MNTQHGFTLIELVVVIVILGLLAATALPKFIDVTTDAREASVQGVAGGLRSAAALGQAQYVVNGDKDAATVTMSGTSVATLVENANAGMGGRPTCAGIFTAMPAPDGYTISPVNAAACGSTTAAITFTPQGGGPNCYVQYDPDRASDPVVVDITQC